MSITATRPPGRQTRIISRRIASGSEAWWKENRVATRSNVSEAYGSDSPMPSTNLMLAMPRRAASWRPRSSIAGVRSSAVTAATNGATARPRRPVPAATSSTFQSGRGSACSTSQRRSGETSAAHASAHCGACTVKARRTVS